MSFPSREAMYSANMIAITCRYGTTGENILNDQESEMKDDNKSCMMNLKQHQYTIRHSP
jgi:hypothetical protein